MARARREQAQQRREELLDAALTVFAEKGFVGASVKDIAAVCGVTPGLLYHYFPGKQALLVALLAERGVLPELRKRLAAGTGRPATEVLIELATALSRLLHERSDLVRLCFSAAHDPHAWEHFRSIVSEGRRILCDYLASRMAAGELRVHDPLVAAQLFISALVLGQVTGFPPDPHAVVDLVLHGIAIDQHPTQQLPG